MTKTRNIPPLEPSSRLSSRAKKILATGLSVGVSAAGAIAYKELTDHPLIKHMKIVKEDGKAVAVLYGENDGSWLDALLDPDQVKEAHYWVFSPNGTLEKEGYLDIRMQHPVGAVGVLGDYCDLVGKKIVFQLVDEDGAKSDKKMVVVPGSEACLIYEEKKKLEKEFKTEYQPVKHEVTLIFDYEKYEGRDATVEIRDENGTLVYKESLPVTRDPIVIDLDEIPNATKITPETNYSVSFSLDGLNATGNFTTKPVEAFNATIKYDNKTGNLVVTDWGAITPPELENYKTSPENATRMLARLFEYNLLKKGIPVLEANGTSITLQEVLEMPENVTIEKIAPYGKPEKIGEYHLAAHENNTTDVDEQKVKQLLDQLQEEYGEFTNKTLYYQEEIRIPGGEKANITIITNKTPIPYRKAQTGIKVYFWEGHQAYTTTKNVKPLDSVSPTNVEHEEYDLGTVKEWLEPGENATDNATVHTSEPNVAFLEKITGPIAKKFQNLAQKIGALGINYSPDEEDNKTDFSFLVEDGVIKDLQELWEKEPELRDNNTLSPIEERVATLFNQTSYLIVTPHGIIAIDKDPSKVPIKVERNAIKIGYVPEGDGGGGGGTTGGGGVGGDRRGGPGVRT